MGASHLAKEEEAAAASAASAAAVAAAPSIKLFMCVCMQPCKSDHKNKGNTKRSGRKRKEDSRERKKREVEAERKYKFYPPLMMLTFANHNLKLNQY